MAIPALDRELQVLEADFVRTSRQGTSSGRCLLRKLEHVGTHQAMEQAFLDSEPSQYRSKEEVDGLFKTEPQLAGFFGDYYPKHFSGLNNDKQAILHS
jgi:hypothetical protein